MLNDRTIFIDFAIWIIWPWVIFDRDFVSISDCSCNIQMKEPAKSTCMITYAAYDMHRFKLVRMHFQTEWLFQVFNSRGQTRSSLSTYDLKFLSIAVFMQDRKSLSMIVLIKNARWLWKILSQKIVHFNDRVLQVQDHNKDRTRLWNDRPFLISHLTIATLCQDRTSARLIVSVEMWVFCERFLHKRSYLFNKNLVF